MTSTVERLTPHEFETKVMRSGKPVLVDFCGDWCTPCRVVAPIVDQLAADYAERIGVYKVDVDASPDRASRFGVRSIPTFVIFKEGRPVDSLFGVVTLGQLDGLLARVA